MPRAHVRVRQLVRGRGRMGVLLLLLLLRVALLPPVSVAAAALPPSLCAMHIRMHARWSAY